MPGITWASVGDTETDRSLSGSFPRACVQPFWKVSKEGGPTTGFQFLAIREACSFYPSESLSPVMQAHINSMPFVYSRNRSLRSGTDYWLFNPIWQIVIEYYIQYVNIQFYTQLCEVYHETGSLRTADAGKKMNNPGGGTESYCWAFWVFTFLCFWVSAARVLMIPFQTFLWVPSWLCFLCL